MPEEPALATAPRAARRPAGPAAGPVLLGGRYQLTRLLGHGGEASVYAADDLSLGREVAVKLFRRQVAPPSQGSLDQVEARVGAALNHYALTSLIDTGIDTGPDGAPQLYLVMEYVPGETLRARLKRGPMTPSEACWLGFDLAEGIDYMHQTGFLHRDVKPSNILISGIRSVRPVVAKLTDFGIAAKVGEPDFSEFTVGTAAYLSPEQVEGRDARPESDVYSLGLVMLEAITGRMEFPGSVTQSAFERLTRDPRIPAEVPARTAALLRRMTARVPEDRIGLHDAAVEMQQILVDDLVQRRGEALEARPTTLQAGDLGGVVEQGRPGFEAALRLLALAADAPMALLTLREPGRGVRIAASHGFRVHPFAVESDPLRIGGPEAGRRTWAVADVVADPVLHAHPLAADPHAVRAVAATPILDGEGARIGTVHVLDAQPRAFEAQQLRALEDVAALVGREIQLRLAVRRVLFPGR